ncbi:uncharacterized protein LOC124272099 isoform X2 [Haliotis rubra]|uniref:uncharacterized protein LOC124272099 isoform X2 n=1 Tax=Haliotis rubra TaxID=36100 RepID=UPI001EE58958|nr:uncharacterized protein LOC124272099 isoform X2 [Haliotis rubra]
MKQVVVIVVVIIIIIVVVTDQVYTTATEPLEQPRNVKCIFHAKKTVNCTYDVSDTKGHNSYTCYMGACFSDWNANNMTCKDHNLSRLQNTTIRGRCNFDCQPPGATDQCWEDTFIIIIRGQQPNHQVFYCSKMSLKQIEKPGPVGDLTEIKIRRRYVKLNWTKPHPHDKGVYNYTVSITGGRNGSQKIYHKQSKHSGVRKKITGLLPWTSYNVTVTADRAYQGDPTTITVQTLEDVPLSSPTIPNGCFSVINSTALMLYPKSVPVEEQQGKITRYETKTTNYTSYYSLLVNGENDGGFRVSLRAATIRGLSKHPTIFSVSKQDLETQSITSVSLEDGVLTWTASKAEKQFRVYYCTGKMKQNVATCKEELQHQDVGSRMQLSVEDLDCDTDCLYAVSGLQHSRAGMVWSTLQTVFVELQDDIKIVVTVVVCVVIVLTAGFALCCLWMKKKGMCSNYTIHLPDYKHLLGECKSDTKENVAAIKPQVSRDSGNVSMGTDASLGAVRQSQVISQSGPSVKNDANPPEIPGMSTEVHGESSEERTESSHAPGTTSASGGLQPSPEGPQPSSGGPRPIPDNLTDTTGESMWDNSGQSAVSEYRQFAAVEDRFVQDCWGEELDDLSGKNVDEQTTDNLHPSSESVISVTSSCSQSGPSASSYSEVLIPEDGQESSSQESSSQESSRPLIHFKHPKGRNFTKKASQYS